MAMENEEKEIKIWCYGSKQNPQGVLRALEEAGLHLTEDKTAAQWIKDAMADPHNIFFSCRNAYGKPNYINYHNEKELTVYGISHNFELGWKQVFPKKIENLIDLNRVWRPMENMPQFPSDKNADIVLLIWNGKHGAMAKVQISWMSAENWSDIKDNRTFRYWAYADDLLPKAEELSSGV